ncbi:MAG: YsnF/AvaK domain-containing protein [Chloroflexi bacterium]|nr:YsnF/AvaK domain-containing protein [Chloroflexota bacterium]
METEQQSPYSGRPVVDWADRTYELRDVDGDKVGKIMEVNPDFLIVEDDGGWFGSNQTYYVPRSAVREDADEWYLTIDKDELQGMGWTEAPTTSAWATSQAGDQAGMQTGTADQASAGDRSSSQLEGTGTRIRRYEEDLEATKTMREAGEVVVTKQVVEDTKTIEVPVRREEVRVERHAVSDAAEASGATDASAFQSDSIRVPVMEEEVEIRKVPRVVEEIEISKVATQGTERVEDTVRREEVDIQETGTRVSDDR